MDFRTLGLALIWLGALLLAAVLIQRVRRGAWDAEAFDDAPTVDSWPKAFVVAALCAVVAGAGLMAWEFL